MLHRKHNHRKKACCVKHLTRVEIEEPECIQLAQYASLCIFLSILYSCKSKFCSFIFQRQHELLSFSRAMQAHQQVKIQKILNAAHYSSCSLQRCGLLWSLTEVCWFHLFMPLLCFTPQTNMPINILNNAKCYCNNNKERGQYIRVITESLWQTRRRAGTHFLLPLAEGVKSIIRFGACILIRKDCVNGAGMLAAASCWL